MAIATKLILLSFLCCLSQSACAAPEIVTDFYQDGPYAVATETVRNVRAICCELFVAIPATAGRYPVVQFQHGTQLRNTDYTELISQVASWGFIVVAPQMYTVVSPDATSEITNARAILNWMKTGLLSSLPRAYSHHVADFTRVALAGHSRGGLVVFGLALHLGLASSQPYSAIVGLDPVDAARPFSPTILPGKENSMNVGVPTLIVGSGLGSQRSGIFSPCAPKDLGHMSFFKDVTPASFHFVAPDYGHMDFTDDCGWLDTVSSVRCWPLCWDGPERRPMREFSAGIMVAFLQDALFHNNASLLAALAQQVPSPVALEPPQSKGKIIATYQDAEL